MPVAHARKALNAAYKVFANASERLFLSVASSPGSGKPFTATGCWGRVPRPVLLPVFVVRNRFEEGASLDSRVSDSVKWVKLNM